MTDLIEKLLEPISGDKPCGPDLSNDPRFEELENLLKGKPEVDIGAVKKPAEPPDWAELQSKSAEFLRLSKHLRVAVILCCSLLRTGGLAGFRDGLQVVRGLLERYWGTVHPLLDPEDNNDPTYRLNILGALTAPRGGFLMGWLTIIDYLYTAPLCRPKGAPPVTFDQLQAAKLKAAGAEGAPADAPTLASLAGALRSTASDVAANHQALQEALEALKGIDQFLTTTLSAGQSISFEELQNTLQAISTGLKEYLPGAAETGPSSSPVSRDRVAASGAEAVGITITGSIRSRDDVVRALESICQYYAQIEPGSPVPFLLRRAQKLARMNFVEAMKELNLATVEALRPSMGSAVDGDTPPAPSA